MSDPDPTVLPPSWPWWPLLVTASTWSFLDTWISARQTSEPTLPLPLSHLAVWAGVALLAGLAGALTCRLVTLGRAHLGRCLAVGVAVTLLFQAWHGVGAIQESVGSISHPVIGVSLIGMLIAAVIWLTFRLSAEPHLPWLYFIVIAALVGPGLIGAIVYLAQRPFTSTEPVDDATVPISIEGEPRDLYVLILDEYGRADVLQEQLGIDTTQFNSSLEREGFDVVERAISNYPHTWASVGALLTMDYPIMDGPMSPAVGEDFRRILAGENRLFQAAQEAGHEVVVFENSWTFTDCAGLIDRCVPGAWRTSLDYAIAQKTPLGTIFPSMKINPWVAGSIQQLENVVQEARGTSDHAKLVFAHALIPHGPYQARTDCTTYYDPELAGYRYEGEGELRARVEAYGEQIGCVNRLVSEFAEALPEDAVAIVTRDHGSAFGWDHSAAPETWSRESFVERFGIFLAVHLPDGCEHPPETTSLVNGIRAAAWCAMGTDLPPVEDRVFAVPRVPDGSAVVELTELVADLAD